MSFYNYLDKAGESCSEILFDLTREEEQQLYNRVKALAYDGYSAFVREHQTDILKYISLTLSRRQAKKWVNNPDLLLIRLAAFQLSSATADFLREISLVSDIVNGGSYRSFLSAVCDAYVLRMLDCDPLRNFEYFDFGDPFE